MGLELQAIELDAELEWAEAQGRVADARDLRGQLFSALNDLASVASRIAA